MWHTGSVEARFRSSCFHRLVSARSRPDRAARCRAHGAVGPGAQQAPACQSMVSLSDGTGTREFESASHLITGIPRCRALWFHGMRTLGIGVLFSSLVLAGLTLACHSEPDPPAPAASRPLIEPVAPPLDL